MTSAYFASLISPGEGRLAIGVNNRIRAATRLVITSFTRAGAQFDRYESPLGGILELHPDASGQIHLGGVKDVPVKYVGYFEQVLRYQPRFWILPHDFLPTPSLIGELKSQGRLRHWGSLGTMWNCPSLPCNAAFTASLSSANGASWKRHSQNPRRLVYLQTIRSTSSNYRLKKNPQTDCSSKLIVPSSTMEFPHSNSKATGLTERLPYRH